MTVDVTVPDIGDFNDVPVVTILVSVGDTIAAEDPIVELERATATMEVPSSHAGVVKAIKVSEGDTVSEGSLILVLEAADGAAAAPAASPATAPAAAPAAAATPAAAPVAAAPVAVDTGFSKAHASPSVRAFARQLEVDLNKVNGTGRKGRILREDVTKFLKSTTAPAPAKGAAPAGGMGIPPIPVIDFSKFGPVEDVDMPRIKKISGPALHRAWLNIPHVTHNDEADITDLDKYRKEMDTMAKENGYRVTLLSFVVKASVSALKQHWEFNSSIHPDGDKLIKKNFYNIGFAADTPNGLMVPVIKDADKNPAIAGNRPDRHRPRHDHLRHPRHGLMAVRTRHQSRRGQQSL